jgi:hypothetical protein
MKKKSKLLGVAILMSILCIVFFVYIFSPKSIISVIGLHPSDIDLCSIIINGTTGASRDFKSEELSSVLQILEDTDVKYIRSDSSISTPLDVTEYLLFFQNSNRKVVSSIIASNGYFYCHGNQYKILGENSVDIIGFLRDHVPCQYGEMS